MKVVRYKHVGQASRENEADVAVEPLREVSSGNSKHLTSTPQIGFFGQIYHVLAGTKVRCNGLEIYFVFASTGSQKTGRPEWGEALKGLISGSGSGFDFGLGILDFGLV